MENKYVYQWQFMFELAHLCMKYDTKSKHDFAVLTATLIDLLAATNVTVQLSPGNVADVLNQLQETDDRKPKFRVK